MRVAVSGRRVRVGSTPYLTQVSPDDGSGLGLVPGSKVTLSGRASAGSYLYLRASSLRPGYVAYGEALFTRLGLDHGGKATIRVRLERQAPVRLPPPRRLDAHAGASHARRRSRPEGEAASAAGALRGHPAAGGQDLRRCDKRPRRQDDLSAVPPFRRGAARSSARPMLARGPRPHRLRRGGLDASLPACDPRPDRQELHARERGDRLHRVADRRPPALSLAALFVDLPEDRAARHRLVREDRRRLAAGEAL